MQLKTVSSIGLAFLLVVGVVGVASAQVEVAATQGILIRVDAPKANEWAAIRDTIRIRVLCYDGRLNQGFQLAVIDSSVSETATTGVDITTVANDFATKIYYSANYNGSQDTTTPFEITKGDGGPAPAGSGSGVDTFRVKIPVVAMAGLESVSNHALKVVVDPANEDPLNNLMRNRKITPAIAGFGATRVGDGKLFGVDGARPIHGDVFESIDLDLGRLNPVMVDTSGTGPQRHRPERPRPLLRPRDPDYHRQGIQSGAESEYRRDSRRQGGQDRSRSRARRLDCAL